MRIAICSHDGENYFGGTYEWVKRIGQEWRKRNYEVVYLFLSDHSKFQSSTYQQVKALGFEAHLLRKHSWTQWHDHTTARSQWFVKKVKAIQPDVFIANITLEALYACSAIEGLDIKTYGVYHTSDKRYLWFKDIFIDQRNYGPSNIVYVSKFLHERYGNSENDFVIGCGTPTSNLTACYHEAVFKLVYVGKITNEAKRIIDNVKSFIEYSHNFPDQKVEFHIYGDGDQRKELTDLIAPYRKSIYYHGFLNPDEVLATLAKYQAFVLLSDYEGLPLSVMEAMAVGLVPICLDIESGIPELIDHNINGFRIKNREKAFHEIIQFLVEHPEKWKAMSSAAKMKIQKSYDMHAIGDLWDQAFKLGKIDEEKTELKLSPVHPLLAGIDMRLTNKVEYINRQKSRIANKVRKLLLPSKQLP